MDIPPAPTNLPLGSTALLVGGKWVVYPQGQEPSQQEYLKMRQAAAAQQAIRAENTMVSQMAAGYGARYEAQKAQAAEQLRASLEAEAAKKAYSTEHTSYGEKTEGMTAKLSLEGSGDFGKIYNPMSKVSTDPGLYYNPQDTTALPKAGGGTVDVPTGVYETYLAGPSNPYYQAAEARIRGLTGFYRTTGDQGETGNVLNPKTGLYSRAETPAPILQGVPKNVQASLKLAQELGVLNANISGGSDFGKSLADVNNAMFGFSGGKPSKSLTMSELMIAKGAKLTEAQAKSIDIGLAYSTGAAREFFALSAPSEKVKPVTRVESKGGSPFDFLGAALTLPELLYSGAGAIQEGISGVSKAAYGIPVPTFSFLENPSMPFQIPGVTSFNPKTAASTAISTAATVASTVPFVLSLPFGAKFAATQPAAVPSKAVEIVTGMFGDIVKSEAEHPGSAIGTALGMYIGGKALGAAGGKVASAVPFEINVGPRNIGIGPLNIDIQTKIPTGEYGKYNVYSFVSVKNPLAQIPTSKVVGGIAYGEDIPGVKFYKGAPTEIMKGTNVGITDLFNVRDVSKTPSPAQMRLIDPFLRTVSKGTESESIISSLFDIKKTLPVSERTLQYKTAQPVGSARQLGTTPEVKGEIFEVLAKSESRYVGSQALEDILGKGYLRDVSKSDIDISMPKHKLQPAKIYIEELYKKNPETEIFLARTKSGFSFRDASGEKPLGVHPAEKYPDVRTFSATTSKGTPMQIQTPEYSIESKASRLFEEDTSFVSYSPKVLKDYAEELEYYYEMHPKDVGYVSVSLGGGKVSTDVADIFASARGIAKTAYEQKQYGLGKIYERASLNLKKYAKSVGKAEVIESIPKDILKGVYRGGGAGKILGVDLAAMEYPISKGKNVGEPRPSRIIPYAITKQYPETKGTAGGYPITIPYVVPKFGISVVEEYPPAKGPFGKGSTYPFVEPSKTSNYPETIVTTKPIKNIYTPGVVEPPYPAPVPIIPTDVPPLPKPSILKGIGVASVGATGFPRAKETRIPLPVIYTVKKDEYPPHRVKPRRQRGKRFAEVFSFDIFKGMKVPQRLYIKDYESTAGGKANRFKETFSLVTKRANKKISF